ncbi:MAG: vWA domain-containing protein [Canibacter sp.]
MSSLSAAGRLLGVEVQVKSGAEWTLENDAVTVGEEFFTRDGHPAREAQALTLVTLWRLVRLPRLNPLMTLRRARLHAHLPQVEPLLAAIDVLISGVKTASAFPAEAPWISAALSRRLSAELAGSTPADLPRHAQFISCVIDQICGSAQLQFLPEIHARLTSTDGDVPVDLVATVRHVLDADLSSSLGISQWEALYALLRTPYFQLLQDDLADRGITQDATAITTDSEDDTNQLNLTEGESESDAEATEDSQQARAASHKDASEGADLFISEQTALIERMLPSPMPLSDVVAAALDASQRPVHVSAQAGATNLTVEGEVSLTDASPLGAVAYEARAHKYSREINELRELWMHLTSSQLRPRTRRSSRTIAEGSELASEALAQAIAETRAGVRRPHAFLETSTKPRQRDNIAQRDYILLVDRSASMQGATAEYTADAVLILLEALAGLSRSISELEDATDTDLGLGIRSALVLFDEHCEVVKPLSTGLNSAVRQEFHEKIQLPQGATHDGHALEVAEQILAGSPSPSTRGKRKAHIVLVGDGGTHDSAKASSQLDRLRKARISVTAVGVGTAGEEMIHRFSPDGFWVRTPRELPNVFREIISRQVSA